MVCFNNPRLLYSPPPPASTVGNYYNHCKSIGNKVVCFNAIKLPKSPLPPPASNVSQRCLFGQTEEEILCATQTLMDHKVTPTFGTLDDCLYLGTKVATALLKAGALPSPHSLSTACRLGDNELVSAVAKSSIQSKVVPEPTTLYWCGISGNKHHVKVALEANAPLFPHLLQREADLMKESKQYMKEKKIDTNLRTTASKHRPSVFQKLPGTRPKVKREHKEWAAWSLKLDADFSDFYQQRTKADDSEKQTCLRLACEKSYDDIIQMLLVKHSTLDIPVRTSDIEYCKEHGKGKLIGCDPYRLNPISC